MTAERVSAEQNHVGCEEECAQRDAEMRVASIVGEPHRLPRVMPQEDQKNQREVEEVAMNVLNDQRKRSLSPVFLPRFSHRTRRGIGPERLVVRAAVVVAGETKPCGKWQDYESRREWQKRRPPEWFGAKPRRGRIAEQERRVER